MKDRIAEIDRDIGIDRAVREEASAHIADLEKKKAGLYLEEIGFSSNLELTNSWWFNHAQSVFEFAAENNLDPKWLGGKVGQAVSDVSIAARRAMKIERPSEKASADDWYKYGITGLTQSPSADGSIFNQFARAAFKKAEDVADLRGIRVSSHRVSFFYRFLQELAPALRQIVHDDYWNNY